MTTTAHYADQAGESVARSTDSSPQSANPANSANSASGSSTGLSEATGSPNSPKSPGSRVATVTRDSLWRRFRYSSLSAPTVIIAAIWLLFVALAALAPTAFSGQDPINGSIGEKLISPGAEHIFGTDQLGRDIFARVVHGTSLTVRAVFTALAISLVGGIILGALAGFTGGRTDALIMRLVDVLLAVPGLLLSLAVIVALGFGTVNVAVAVGVTGIASIARVMRSEVLKVRQTPFVDAARAAGATRFRILWRHVAPNSLGPVIVYGVLEFGNAVLAISALSFLGYGAPPPTPEWGALVAQGRDYLAAQSWISTMPGLVITATVLSTNRLAQALRR